ncbi:MAG: hypothetical protein ACK5HY_09820 [Parahaliea sp.]
MGLLTAASPRKVGMAEISDRLGIPKNTCMVIIAELWAQGYVVRESSSRAYGIGPKTVFAPASGLFPDDASARLNRRLGALASALEVPIALVHPSRRSTVVVNAVNPCSRLGELGCRRPLVAPFGASFIAHRDFEDQNHWMETALRDVSGDACALRRALRHRLDTIRELGYEVVSQQEEDILSACERGGSGLCDVFSFDAAMHGYRRKLLTSRPAVEAPGARQQGGPVSRVVLPFGPQGGEDVGACVEFWLQGRSMTAVAVAEFVRRAREVLADILLAA